MLPSFVMTREEIITALTSEYLEEVEGIKSYVKMIQGIEAQDPNHKYLPYLRAIVKDEYTHQKYIYKMLVEMDAFVPANISKAMKEVKESYESL